jgi:hypothetical protein
MRKFCNFTSLFTSLYNPGKFTPGKFTARMVVLLVVVLVFTGMSLAQDSTPAPTEEPTPAVDTVITTTTTTTAPAADIGLSLSWALAFLALWQAAGLAYAVTVEKSLKPMLYSLVGSFTENESVRNAALIIVVFIGAFLAVQAGGINLFADAPFGLLTNASEGFLLVLNSLFVAAGAFMGHEIWTALESWLKKAKAISDILNPAQPVQEARNVSQM